MSSGAWPSRPGSGARCRKTPPPALLARAGVQKDSAQPRAPGSTGDVANCPRLRPEDTGDRAPETQPHPRNARSQRPVSQERGLGTPGADIHSEKERTSHQQSGRNGRIKLPGQARGQKKRVTERPADPRLVLRKVFHTTCGGGGGRRSPLGSQRNRSAEARQPPAPPPPPQPSNTSAVQRRPGREAHRRPLLGEGRRVGRPSGTRAPSEAPAHLPAALPASQTCPSDFGFLLRGPGHNLPNKTGNPVGTHVQGHRDGGTGGRRSCCRQGSSSWSCPTAPRVPAPVGHAPLGRQSAASGRQLPPTPQPALSPQEKARLLHPCELRSQTQQCSLECSHLRGGTPPAPASGRPPQDRASLGQPSPGLRLTLTPKCVRPPSLPLPLLTHMWNCPPPLAPGPGGRRPPRPFMTGVLGSELRRDLGAPSWPLAHQGWRPVRRPVRPAAVRGPRLRPRPAGLGAAPAGSEPPSPSACG